MGLLLKKSISQKNNNHKKYNKKKTCSSSNDDCKDQSYQGARRPILGTRVSHDCNGHTEKVLSFDSIEVSGNRQHLVEGFSGSSSVWSLPWNKSNVKKDTKIPKWTRRYWR